MTPAGWLTMILSVGFVTGLFSWCIFKVVTTKDEADKVHGFEFETPDKDDADPKA
jgi:hypothetical protein